MIAAYPHLRVPYFNVYVYTVHLCYLQVNPSADSSHRGDQQDATPTFQDCLSGSDEPLPFKDPRFMRKGL